MVKYVLTAIALKAFSCSRLTKRLYRALGNTVGARKRTKSQIPGYYIERVNRMLSLSKRYGVPKDSDTLLELGTRFVHWEAITSRLFFNIHGVLFDV
jgi:hypothetical protein